MSRDGDGFPRGRAPIYEQPLGLGVRSDGRPVVLTERPDGGVIAAMAIDRDSARRLIEGLSKLHDRLTLARVYSVGKLGNQPLPTGDRAHWTANFW